jgi:ferredoxin
LLKAYEKGAPVLVEHLGEDLWQAAEEAADLCPNGAISIREDL